MSQHPPTRQPPRFAASGPVRPTANASTVLRPAPVASVRGGFWHGRREVNARVGIPQGPDLLESAGNLHDLRLAAGTATGAYRGDYPFMDSDVYKWLEAAAWQLAQAERAGDREGTAAKQLGEDVERIIGLVAEAQKPDGYLNTWFQVTKDGRTYEDLRWGHELYCAGHLIQAAVAHHRATGREELLRVAVRFADNIDSVFGPDKPIDGFDAHPEVETALVELFRETGERRYLRLASYFVDRHGHGLVGGETYCQDRVPLREAENVEGHAVRQLYLLAAAADLATETGEAELREACARLWEAMVATKTHITGGLGAHHEREEFGDPFELPNERAYCETCAAVASVQWSWRMALLTGEARYSDLIERTLYNGLLAGVSLDGERWLYVNPLQVRDGHVYTGDDKSARRTRWFRCACCPPNVMRLLAGLEYYMATTDGEGIGLHQYATGTYGGECEGEALVVSVNTSYPYEGRITVTVDESPADLPWTLSLRIPRWSARTAVRVDGKVAEERARDGWLRLHRRWVPGTEVVVDLDVAPRLTGADPRVDAVRGCVAIERGPLVYCLEQVDHPGGGLDDIVIDTSIALAEQSRPDLLGGVVTVTATGRRRERPGISDWWPYQDVTGGRDATMAGPGPAAPPGGGAPLTLTAVPYHAWANRADGAMRVWLPTT